jgi:hypothetical protein
MLPEGIFDFVADCNAATSEAQKTVAAEISLRHGTACGTWHRGVCDPRHVQDAGFPASQLGGEGPCSMTSQGTMVQIAHVTFAMNVGNVLLPASSTARFGRRIYPVRVKASNYGCEVKLTSVLTFAPQMPSEYTKRTNPVRI